MVSGEAFPIVVRGQPGTTIPLALDLPQVPLAAWLSASSVTIGADGSGNATLYLAGGVVSSSSATPSTVPLIIAFGTGNITVPVEPTEPVFLIGSGSRGSPLPIYPSVVVNPGHHENILWGIAYVPSSANAPNLSVSLSTMVTASWLKMWSYDQDDLNAPYSTQPFVTTIQPYQVRYFFTTVSAPQNSPYEEQTVVVNLLMNGQSYQVTLNVDIMAPIVLGSG